MATLWSLDVFLLLLFRILSRTRVIRKWQYQLIHFFLSPILSYYITTRKDNMVKEKGLACSQKGEIDITTA